jgi:arylsulfatase A-like enzyme
VPCIASWPGTLKPGKHDAPVQIIDWMPTFCALAGFKTEQDLKWDGVNLWPQLAEGVKPPVRSIYTVAPGFKSRSFRVGDFKLVLQNKNNTEKAELYDIVNDPNETKSLAAELPDKVAELQAALTVYAKTDKDAVAND